MSSRYRSLAAARCRTLWMCRTLWIADADGALVEPSAEWQRVTGQTREEARGFGWLNALHPEDRDTVAQAWKQAVAEPDCVEHICRLRARDGSFRYHQIVAIPIWSEGRVVEWVGTDTDVDGRVRAQRRQELLGRVAALAGAPLDLDDRLRVLAHAVVPALADAAFVDLVVDPPADDLRHADPTQGHADPTQEILTVRQMAIAVRPGLERPARPARACFQPCGLALRAYRAGQPVLTRLPVSTGWSCSADQGVREWADKVGAHSQVLLPLFADGTATALVTLVNCGDRPAFTDDDLALMQDVFVHAVPALEHTLRYRRTEQIALALQHSLLTEPPRVPGLQVAVRYRPGGDDTEIGGDWYDAFLLGDGDLALVIGDVVGHDLTAITAMGQLRNLLRGIAYDADPPPHEAVTRLDRANAGLGVTSLASLVYGRVERTAGRVRLRWTNAGHPPPLLLHPDGSHRVLQRDHADLPLGIDPAAARGDAVCDLPPGSTLLLYTDGLVETRTTAIDENIGRLARTAGAAVRLPLERLVDHVLAGSPPTDDDTALIALRVGDSQG